MEILSFNVLAAIQIAWIAAAVWRFLKRSDEIPLLTSVLVAYFGPYRYFAVLSGWSDWADISNFGIGQVTNGSALHALRTMMLGESVFLATYFAFQKQAFAPVRFSLAPAFARQVHAQAVTGAVFLLPITFFVNRIVSQKVESGVSMAFGISAYLYLFPLVLSTLAIVLVILWRYGNLPSGDRILALALIGAIFYTTFGVSGRFKFLSWLIASAVILTASYTAARRLGLLSAFIAATTVVFVLAGAQRTEIYYSADGGVKQAVWDRFQTAEDANMLDGLVFLEEIFPSQLPFRYGGEHLEILYRPIPRAWWPNKPVNNYLMRLGAMAEGGATLGISPSLFGSFYQEGGYVGIVVLSMAYAFVISRMIRFSTSLHPFASLLVRCLICAALVPLLRGGDLPGTYAWLGAAFWPLLLLFALKRKQLAKDSPWFLQTPVAGGPVAAGKPRRRGRDWMAPASAVVRSRD